MNRQNLSRLTFHLLASAVVAAALTSSASAEWKEKVLYSFQGGTDGSTHAGGVVFDAVGNLYGATTDGGSSCPSPGCGTVFQLAPPATKGGAWTETILFGFSGNDGSFPAGSVIVDANGNLYGTTAYGGSGTCILLGGNVGCGIVYELSPPLQKGGQWTYRVLYNFQGGKDDGQYPWGNLTLDKAGNLFGATQFGGGKGYNNCNKYYGYCGIVYKLSPPKVKGGKWTEKVLHSFAGGTDGANPNGGLIFDTKGTIYGTTYGGGNESGEQVPRAVVRRSSCIRQGKKVERGPRRYFIASTGTPRTADFRRQASLWMRRIIFTEPPSEQHFDLHLPPRDRGTGKKRSCIPSTRRHTVRKAPSSLTKPAILTARRMSGMVNPCMAACSS